MNGKLMDKHTERIWKKTILMKMFAEKDYDYE